jgi:hypothetical protein
MTKTTTIRLGQREFTAGPMTLGRYEDLTLAFLFSGEVKKRATTPDELRASYKRRYGVVLAAIGAAHPDITEADLRAIEGATVDQLNEAESQCLILAGLVKEGATPPPGEDAPAAVPTAESTSPGSTVG